MKIIPESIKSCFKVICGCDSNTLYRKKIIDGKVYYIISYEDFKGKKINYKITPEEVMYDLVKYKYNRKLAKKNDTYYTSNAEDVKYEIYEEIIRSDDGLIKRFNSLKRSFLAKMTNQRSKSRSVSIVSESFPSDKLSENSSIQSVIYQPFFANLCKPLNKVIEDLNNMSKQGVYQINLWNFINIIIDLFIIIVSSIVYSIGKLITEIIQFINSLFNKFGYGASISKIETNKVVKEEDSASVNNSEKSVYLDGKKIVVKKSSTIDLKDKNVNSQFTINNQNSQESNQLIKA
ncbi:hypothetical protein HERIO_318 [Hepatospora eriocheir]|uniref:Uncharacterized protein n=1 Tax=Hepatospora eriocheir TaxID=1081669 RepID=A0A1X0QDW8_9MICR|nr:hypothetical protein HERIO_318 [Hepatospora eriocheir]